MIDAAKIEELHDIVDAADSTRIRALSAENERLKTMLTGGNLEIVESEQAWKLRAESSEALVAELREKVERLTKALMPFAKAAASIDTLPELIRPDDKHDAPTYLRLLAEQVTIADLRRARSELEGR